MAKILVIDDSNAILHSLDIALSASGHDVTLADGGKPGLDAFRLSKFDLVVTDMLMPDVDGILCIREIKRLQPSAKIIAMSGGGQMSKEQLLKYAQAFGVIDVLKKPFNNADLIHRVDACLK